MRFVRTTGKPRTVRLVTCCPGLVSDRGGLASVGSTVTGLRDGSGGGIQSFLPQDHVRLLWGVVML